VLIPRSFGAKLLRIEKDEGQPVVETAFLSERGREGLFVFLRNVTDSSLDPKGIKSFSFAIRFRC
jgi:hypothetical protein